MKESLEGGGVQAWRLGGLEFAKKNWSGLGKMGSEKKEKTDWIRGGSRKIINKLEKSGLKKKERD